MKEYELTVNNKGSSVIVEIINKDTNPVILSLEIICNDNYDEIRKRYVYDVKINFNQITDAIKQLFLHVPEVEFNSTSVCMSHQFDKLKLIALFDVVQKLDELHFIAIAKIHSFAHLDLIDVLIHQELLKKLIKSDHEGALKVALGSLSEYRANNTFKYLLNYYSKNNDQLNYRNILRNYPAKYPLCKEYSAELLELINAETSPKDPIAHLEDKLRAALKSEQTSLATEYFNRLCSTEEKKEIKDIKGDPEMFIEIAKQFRAMREEIQSLQNQKQEEQKTENRVKFFN